MWALDLAHGVVVTAGFTNADVAMDIYAAVPRLVKQESSETECSHVERRIVKTDGIVGWTPLGRIRSTRNVKCTLYAPHHNISLYVCEALMADGDAD